MRVGEEGWGEKGRACRLSVQLLGRSHADEKDRVEREGRAGGREWYMKIEETVEVGGA